MVEAVIDKQTWETIDSDTWPWHEALEGNVTRERHAIEFPKGISWETKDLSIEIEPAFEPDVVYEQKYTAPPESKLEVVEDWSRDDSTEDSQSIELSQGISLGTESTAKVGFNIKAVECGVEQKTTMSLNLGANEAFSKTKSTKVHFGRAVTFTVPAGKTYKVQYIFDKGERTVDFKIKVKASGWVYLRAAFKDKPGITQNHVYPWKIYGEGPQGFGSPLPEDLRTFEVTGSYKHVKHLKGRFIVTDETGKNITDKL